MIRPTRAAFVFIFITVTLDMLALGIMAPCCRSGPAVGGVLGAPARAAARRARHSLHVHLDRPDLW